MKYLLFLIPVLILLDLYLWTKCTALLSAPSDISVFLGVLLICITAFSHYLLFKLLKSKIRQ